MGREEGLVVQFKECVLVTMTHPLELKLRTSTKDPKARSRVGKQARSQSSHTAPIGLLCFAVSPSGGRITLISRRLIGRAA